jgi:4-carboxymuconolactone decarboxylase
MARDGATRQGSGYNGPERVPDLSDGLGRPLLIDGFNLIFTLESALGRGVVQQTVCEGWDCPDRGARRAYREMIVTIWSATRNIRPHYQPETRAEKGLAVQKQIIGSDVVEKLYASAPPDQQHIQRFLSANCFGDHITRTGVDVPTRELLTFSMLVSLGGCDAQVKGHVAANLNVGNDRPRLIDVLTQLLPFIGYPRMLNGLRVVDEVTASSTTRAAANSNEPS